MTKRQANIYKAIWRAFEKAEQLKETSTREDYNAIMKAVEETAEANELSKIEELAFLFALQWLW